MRGQDTTTLVLLCISTAIASIPTGLPTFVQAMLSSGARRLAEHKAVVKSLTRRGDPGRDHRHQQRQDRHADDERDDRDAGCWAAATGSRSKARATPKTGAILGVAGAEPLPDFRNLALGLVLCTDATVGDDGSVIGDPTEAAFVVLAAKMGVGAEETREALPRRAEVPFDSEYKFMATFHDRPDWLAGPVVAQPHLVTVKGAPDVVLDRCDARPVAWQEGADRNRPGRDPGRQPQAVRTRAAGARLRRQGHG